MEDLSASFEFADMDLFLRSVTRDIVGATTDVYPNGKPKIYMPYNVNGELHGDYIEFYENGQVSYKITYENGLRQGKSITYLENGKIIEETNYIDGKKEKEHLFYDEKEKLIKTEIYKNDVKQ